MARILFFTILAMCLICMLKANPVADQPTTSSPVDDIKNALQTAADSVQKGFEEFVNHPTIKKMVEDTAKFVANSANALSEEAQKVIPKTKV